MATPASSAIENEFPGNHDPHSRMNLRRTRSFQSLARFSALTSFLWGFNRSDSKLDDLLNERWELRRKHVLQTEVLEVLYPRPEV